MHYYNLFINGEWIEDSKGNYFPTINPFDQQIWAYITQASNEQIDAAVISATNAFNSWKNVTGKEKTRLLNNLADLIDENSTRLAKLETTDNGKVIRETTNQMKFVARNYRFFAGYSDKLYGETIPLDNNDLFNYTKREPIGVIALITSWNSPLSILTNKLAPALAAGNTVVIKPSEYTSATTLEFVKLIEQAGFPKGVVNVVTGDYKVGDYLTKNKNINKVSFTGGTSTGKIILSNTSENLVKSTLELGGKSPNIVFEDANLDAAVTGAVAGIFGASGQTCIAGSRLLVQESIYDHFLEKLVSRTKKIKLGNPIDQNTEMGPVANKIQYDNILKIIEQAKRQGAKQVVGFEEFEEQLDRLENGYFIPPTIFSDVNNQSEIARNEIFGPVLCVIPFVSEEHALELANDSEFGLAAGIWTSNLQKAHNLADKIQAGTIWINTYRTTAAQAPFGGFKMSGYGKERGYHALLEYTQVKNVMVNLSNQVRDPFTIQN